MEVVKVTANSNETIVTFVLPDGKRVTPDSVALRKFAEQEIQAQREKDLMSIAYHAGWAASHTHHAMQMSKCREEFFKTLPQLVELKS